MQKECFGGLINSRNGKVNALLLFSILLIFVVASFGVYAAISITQVSPKNLSTNNSRNANFTFTVTWGALSGDESVGNCSIWTNITGTWAETVKNSSNSTSSAIYNSSTSVSYINTTLSQDGKFNWSVRCTSITGTAGENYSVNRSLLVDATAPNLLAITPNTTLFTGSTWGVGGTGNFTGWPIKFQVNASDNNTITVYYILNSSHTASGIGVLENTTPVSNVTRNTTMNLEFDPGNNWNISAGYAHNISLNFSSLWRGPGAHSVVFCANDSVGNRRCIGSYDFLMVGINVTQMESVLSGFGGTGNFSTNITYANGTEISAGDDDPYLADSYVNPLILNLTFIFNFSIGGSITRIHMVGMSIDETLMGNASNTNITSTPSQAVISQVGTGFSTTMAGGDFTRFIPDFVRYKFGVIELSGVGFNKHLYCSGRDLSSPNCTSIRVCNATAFGGNNATAVLNTIIGAPDSGSASACYLEGNVGSLYGVALTAGRTYIFVQHFSNIAGGNDTVGPVFNFTAPANTNEIFNVSTVAIRAINFVVNDTNGTGINLTRNNTINLSIWLGDSVVQFYNYTNQSGINRLTCTTTDATSPGNSTIVSCNASFNFNSNGTYYIIAAAQDASNNTNYNQSNITLILDQIPPVNYNNSGAYGQFYYNFTTNSTFNASTSSGVADGTVLGLGLGNGVSRAQGGTIFAFSNWTDNLTQPLQAALQFYNVSISDSSTSWKTLNTTPAGEVLMNVSRYSNFSFPIPSGHNEFEGKNVSFRIIANDTLGNVNTSTVRNFTIQINDTTRPTITITQENGTNYSTNKNIAINWSIVEVSTLAAINWSVDDDKSAEEAGSGCNDFGKFNTVATADGGKRNYNYTLFPSTITCTEIANGTHYLVINARDIWGNIQKFNYTFGVETGQPVITLSGFSNGTAGGTNQSTVTPSLGINFSATAGGTSLLKNLSWVSSCNSTAQVFANNTAIGPFNYSGCKGVESNFTVNVTVADFSGNTLTNTFQFAVDDLAPTISVDSPKNGASFTDFTNISVSALDSMSFVHTIGYYIDNDLDLKNHTVFNGSSRLSNPGVNTSVINKTFNHTGTHTLKVSVNDSMGNVRNSSVITFTQTGTLIFNEVSTSIGNYSATVFNNVSLVNASVRIKTGQGSYQLITASNETSTNTYELLFNMNGTTNVSLTEINGSAANWNAINFTPYVNQTSFIRGLEANWTTTVIRSVWFNNSIEKFIPNNNSYYGIVVFPINNTHTANASEFWWIENEDVLSTRVNITQCTGAFSVTSTTPCWNYTSGGRTIIQVPHFSVVVAVNNTGAPTINVTTPVETNQSVSTFAFNITVSQDAVSCVYAVNGTVPSVTMTKSGNICTGSTGSFTNLISYDGGYNVTFNVSDGVNTRTYEYRFNVSDDAPPATPNSSRVSVSVGSTTATVTISINESANATVNAAPNVTGTFTVTPETDFSTSQAVSITGLSASTKYHFNVTVCDFNGNCARNGTSLSFTTSAAAAAAAAAAASSSGGGGSAAGATTTTTTTTTAGTAASASRQWDSIASGTSGVLTINNDQIAVTGVTIDVANTVSNPSLVVASLTSNPVSASAAAKVYQYLQISKYNMQDADASKITISFKVSKSWLTSNGVAESNIILWRYSSGSWNKLNTKLVSSDGANANYEAVTPGFSAFAIGTKESGAAAFEIIDMIRDFYAGTSKLTAFDIIDKIRAFYGG